MASYRAILTIGVLHPDVDPASVVPGIAEAVRAVTTVEAADLAVVRGEARAVIRFTAEDDTADGIADVALDAARSLAQVTRAMLTRRDGSAWVRLS